METDEAEAAFQILRKRPRGEPIAEADWQQVFMSEGYQRLAAREASLGRSFDEADFHAFALSDSLLARTDALAATLRVWAEMDATAAAQRALTYLPPGTALRTTVYPVIKPRVNSFVYDLSGDPAIFLYLDPEVTAAQFDNTLAYELHHVGFAACCSRETEASVGPVAQAITWIDAFAEGFAMLAAAGRWRSRLKKPSDVTRSLGFFTTGTLSFPRTIALWKLSGVIYPHGLRL